MLDSPIFDKLDTRRFERTPWRDRSPAFRGAVMIFGPFLVLAVWLAATREPVAAPSVDDRPAATHAAREMTPADQLFESEARIYGADDMTKRRLRSLLWNLSGATVEESDGIAFATIRAQEQLAAEGIRESAVSMLEQIQKQTAGARDGWIFADVAGSYARNRSQLGLLEAVLGIRDSLRYPAASKP